MDDLETIRPKNLARVMDLLAGIGVDVSIWSHDFKGKHPATNPKYCYNWSFMKNHEFVVACLWYVEFQVNEGVISHSNKLRRKLVGKGATQWNTRAGELDRHLQSAYQEALPIRVIVLAGKPRDEDDELTESSSVNARRMDVVPWAVTFYDPETGDFTVTRGAEPIDNPEKDDPEYSAFEGELRRLYVIHRRRESSLWVKKLNSARYVGDGKIRCEVPNCGFDFKAVYGEIGEGFAHVHHLLPLAEAPASGTKTYLKDLAIVCANCHAMIHIGGKCRPLNGLIPRKTEAA